MSQAVPHKKIVVIMPAYNASRTLAATLRDVPREWVDDIVLCDDASHDGTAAIARSLGIHTLVHPANRGYGGNQKTCFVEALARGADIVVMVHPDHQYDPRVIPLLISTMLERGCDGIFGSRMLGGRALEGGMPLWKYLANIALTWLANRCFGARLTEYHSGFRGYSRRYLESVDFQANSEGFVFDTEIIAQGLDRGLEIREVPIETRYFPEASQIGFWASVHYGLSFLLVLLKWMLHRAGLYRGVLFARPRRKAKGGPAH